MGFDVTGLGSIFNVVNSVIDKIFPDKIQAEQAKLKLVELQQAGEFKQIEADLEKERLANADVASARLRESELAKAGMKDNIPAILAIMITLGFFGILVLFAYVDLDADTAGVLKIMAGVLGTAFVQIISYYFGSSVSSRKKDDIIGNLKNK